MLMLEFEFEFEFDVKVGVGEGLDFWSFRLVGWEVGGLRVVCVLCFGGGWGGGRMRGWSWEG